MNQTNSVSLSCLSSEDIHHRLFDVLLVIVAARSVVIAVHDLNSDVALGETSAPFT